MRHKGMMSILLILGGTVLLAGVWWLYSTPQNSTAFERSVWVDTTRVYSDENPRVRMKEDVLKRLQQGMTRADVVDLLGEPTETSYFPKWDMVYWLGSEKPPWFAMNFGLDSQWLVIRFLDGGLDEARIVTD